MVKAELEYNPYIRETKIKFNGKEPRINSLVEKYQNLIIQNWIDQVPIIFHDEMNGYDFELEFSGPELDFLDLKKAFEGAGIKEEQVRLFLKSELGTRADKQNKIEELLSWLKENVNRNFEADDFFEEHRDDLDFSFSLILIHGASAETDKSQLEQITIETVNDVQDFESTNLENLPIVCYIDSRAHDLLNADISYLLGRNDVMQRQLFFMPDPALDESMLRRLIRDLGIESPQMVHELGDRRIRKYVEIFPQTDRIYECIRLLHTATDELDLILTDENAENEAKNHDIYQKISTLDESLMRLKTARDRFSEEENLEVPESLYYTKDDFLSKIDGWKNRRTKITREDEAIKQANEFERDIARAFKTFCKLAESHLISYRNDYLSIYENWFQETMFSDYSGRVSEKTIIASAPFPSIVKHLLELGKEEQVQIRDDLVGRLFKKAVSETEEPIFETAYYYQDWREYASSVARPIVEEIIADGFNRIQGSIHDECSGYLTHIEELIEKLTREKEDITEQLSDDEKQVQTDNDWLASFKDQLREIERG